MKTVIDNDRIGRFAELDHSVLEEVQVIMEAEAAPADGASPISHLAGPLGWLRERLQRAVRSGHHS